MKKSFSIKKIAYIAICTALVCLATAYIKIPNLTFDGFINLGDVFVIISGVYFGPFVGIFAGGVGSMLGDVLAGYPYWAPFTLFIKSLMGLFAALIGNKSFKKIALYKNGNKKDVLKIILAMFVVELTMVILYFLFKWMMYNFHFFGKQVKEGSNALMIAAFSIKENILQAIGSILITIPLIFIKQLQAVVNNYYVDILPNEVNEKE